MYNMVDSVSKDSTKAGYANARAVLSLINKKHYPEVIYFNPTNQAYRKRVEEVRFANNDLLLRNYPNPFTDETTVEVQVDSKLASPKLLITNVVGRPIITYNLQSGFNEVHLTSLNQPGVYYFILTSESKYIQSGKMICTK